MSVSISIRRYYITDIKQEIYSEVDTEKYSVEHINEIVDKVLPEFGFVSVSEGMFYVGENEYYEDYNAEGEVFKFLSLYFGIRYLYLECGKALYGANAYEVAEKLKIDLPPEVDDFY